MKQELIKSFTRRWEKYFGKAELPITFFYSNNDMGVKHVPIPKGRSCIICELSKARKGLSLCYEADSIACGGAKRYLGYTSELRPGFEYFLSCGIPGKLEGERYKKSPEIVKEMMKGYKNIPAKKYIIFKRWDKLEEGDNPEVVIFFSEPDILSGLFTLANFDQIEQNGVFSPFGAGCGSIVHYPYMEKYSENPRAVIGMFDPSARPCVKENILTFSVPISKFEKMASYMDESFLITDTWKVIKTRIK